MYDIIAGVMELGGLADFAGFSSLMYDRNLYTVTFWVMLLAPVVALVLYYKVFDSVHDNNFMRWVLYGLAGGTVVLLVNLLYVSSQNTKMQLGFSFGDIFGFLLICLLLSSLVYVLLSFLFRYLSTSRRHIPM